MKDKLLKDLIREKNDWLRSQLPNLPEPHRLGLSDACGELIEQKKLFGLIQLIKDCIPEPEDNPYGENDFGAVDYEGTRYYWKFEYFDDNFEFHRENGNRVLTVMHFSEY